MGRKRQTKAKPFPRVLIGLPMERTIPSSCFWDKMRLYHHTRMRGAAWIEDVDYAVRIDVIRNRMAFRLLQTDQTHLLMIDLDHHHPTMIYDRLVAHVKEDPDRLVVAGWNYRRGAPYDPVVQFFDEDGNTHAALEWDDGLIEISKTDEFHGGAVGTGAILIHRKVFEQIEPPWFTFDYSNWAKDKWVGEDITFSRRCQEAGISLFVDTLAESPHLDRYWITRQTWEMYKARERIAETAPKKDLPANYAKDAEDDLG